MAKRCVVTGVGVVSPVGIGKESFWKSLTAGRSGIGPLTYFDTSKLSVHVAGEVKGFDPSKYITEDRIGVTGRYTHFAVAAAKMAVQDAGIFPKNWTDSTPALVVGTTSPPVDSIEDQVRFILQNEDSPRAHPYGLAAVCPHSPTVEISNALGLFDSTCTISTVCTSGMNAIGAGLREIRAGRRETVVAGATESTIVLFTFLGYISAGLMAENTQMAPEKIMRPFDKGRHGAVLSEGSAFVVLEELEHARMRGANIYGEIAGFASMDRFRGSMRTLPVKQGMLNTMKAALADARMQPARVDYVCANGVSTQMLDKMETLALKELFGEYAYRLPISAIKSMLGIPNSSVGPMELVSALLTLQNDIIPPTINYEEPDPDCDLDYVPNEARWNRVNAVLLNNHALDGGNAALVIKRLNA
ncbi:MAG: beta-ketoacyl-[acyl-carrier-protein] synthase family protein [Candidatus Abyssobacteria bacterium SURF_17]|uniref:Beta-ketoacyl-[acyl-carrier-protein] synthase family protein n=1 Tax=Candidatus Abyssobacteria bacterium SURF_17 TaxID=2093361 RepID=A0A419F9K7_9BACT|nr:MAG: beta-ketoacyl-[acyl-carrier-protein] synthase family protein [Candidatus Abyssubacteria bacterium SURF_17]